MSVRVSLLLLIGVLGVGCGVGTPQHGGGGAGGTGGGGTGGSGGGGTGGSGGGGSGGGGGGVVYTVYAHGDHTLYTIDVANKSLSLVGPFKAPSSGGGGEDVITDLAVAPNNTIYVVSNTTLYTADPHDGHVTVVGPVTACGMQNVALSTTPDGKLWVADYKGAFCEIDISGSAPVVKPIGTLGSNMAIAGDIVGVADGTVYATAYDMTVSSTNNNNSLVKMNTMTGQMQTMIGATGFPKLFGVAYAEGQVFGFTHDGTGDVITIDPKTGKGTLFNSFKDPTTNMPIYFAGAGVSSLVPPVIQ
jgi:hypothetical protein